MPPRNKAAKNNIQDGSVSQLQSCCEGERLAHVLESIQRGIKSARALAGNSLPEKVWLKQQFAIGVNDVTRVLERMELLTDEGCNAQSPGVRLQAILLAADCNPKWLTKHIPVLAKSRKVPLILVKDDKKGSLRLGELVKLKTAIAIGVKVRGSAINQIMEGVLDGDESNQGAVLQGHYDSYFSSKGVVLSPPEQGLGKRLLRIKTTLLTSMAFMPKPTRVLSCTVDENLNQEKALRSTFQTCTNSSILFFQRKMKKGQNIAQTCIPGSKVKDEENRSTCSTDIQARVSIELSFLLSYLSL